MVEIELNGKRETLTFTVRAVRAVNDLGGYVKVSQRVNAWDFDAYVAIVAAGLGKKLSEVEDGVANAGMFDLSEPVGRFVIMLANGGRVPSSDVVAEGEQKGNG